MATEANTQSFWEHLDVLRAAIIKIVAVAHTVRFYIGFGHDVNTILVT